MTMQPMWIDAFSAHSNDDIGRILVPSSQLGYAKNKKSHFIRLYTINLIIMYSM